MEPLAWGMRKMLATQSVKNPHYAHLPLTGNLTALQWLLKEWELGRKGLLFDVAEHSDVSDQLGRIGTRLRNHMESAGACVIRV